MKKALITGVSGQDGSYLSEFLISKNYEVHGIIRRVALEDEIHRLWRLRNIKDKIVLHSGSLESFPSLAKIINKVQPDEIYHLAAQSYVANSFEDEFSTLNTNINGTHCMLASMKEFSPTSKFYFAGSSEMFGKTIENPQNENTKFYPRSAYGISKVTGFELTRNYREAYNFFASTGILFNHESPRRGFEFVTRKISLAVARIKNNFQKELSLGNIKAKRDWGHAKDYVEAMWLMLQKKEPSDYVIGTGKQHSVEDFLNIAFKHVGLNFKDYIKIDERFFRPSEVETLLADPTKSKKELGWRPKMNFEDLVKEMVESDLKNVKDNVY
jgi:GDPmannose 4,6-dehydratase